MNTGHYKQILLQRRDELEADIRRYDDEVVNAQVAEAGDDADAAVTDQVKSQSADLSATADGELGMVMDALARIEKGTYGICVDCGEEIPEARLRAVPWAPYCLKDQELHDAAQGVRKPATL